MDKVALILFSLAASAHGQTEVSLAKYQAHYGLTQDLWTSVAVGEYLGISSAIVCGAMCSAKDRTR